MEPDDVVGQLAAQVADGQPVDWGLATSSVSDGDSGVLQQLRTLQRIAQVHLETPEDLAEPPGAAMPPVRWGALTVLECVGIGSFGRVYRGWDTSLDREVAIKLLRPERLQSTSGKATVLREGQMLARVRHPNVVAVYGAQEADGSVGIWCEFLRGRTLAELIRRDGPMSPHEATLYGLAVSRALAAVHKAGLLHRDVKAQNVMREQGGRVVLMDFGLGLDTSAASPGTGSAAGTPVYLAPEVLRGGPPSVYSDVYALGVLLFYLVTGEFPVAGESVAELRKAHECRRCGGGWKICGRTWGTTSCAWSKS